MMEFIMCKAWPTILGLATFVGAIAATMFLLISVAALYEKFTKGRLKTVLGFIGKTIGWVFISLAVVSILLMMAMGCYEIGLGFLEGCR